MIGALYLRNLSPNNSILRTNPEAAGTALSICHLILAIMVQTSDMSRKSTIEAFFAKKTSRSM
jgi:hypothetical protein